MNGGRRRIPLVEEPKRPPWMLIILLIAAGVVILWVVSHSKLTIGDAAEDAEALPPVEETTGRGVEHEDLIQVRPAGPDAVPDQKTATVRLPVDAPRWERAPIPEYPSGRTEIPAEARVTISCVVQPNRSLGDCVIVDEEPSGYGFGAAAVRAARQARLTDEARPGARVTYRTRFVMPE